VEYENGYSFLTVIVFGEDGLKASGNLTRIVLVLVVATFLSSFCFVAFAQTRTAFTANAPFAIPEKNGNVYFSMNGTYEQSNLENGTWVFENIRSNFSQRPLNLSVSAQDSNINITSYRTTNITFLSTSLRYVVSGQGKQTFKLDLAQTDGEWSVTINGAFIGENDGWAITPDKTLTITGAPSNSNVTMSYFSFPDSFGGNGNNSNLPFYQQHSVIIATAIAVAIALALVTTITFVAKKKKQSSLTEASL
jgi:hypothetical protein